MKKRRLWQRMPVRCSRVLIVAAGGPLVVPLPPDGRLLLGNKKWNYKIFGGRFSAVGLGEGGLILKYSPLT